MATPAQQGQQCQHDKGIKANTLRAMMPAQRRWQCQHNWQCQGDKRQRLRYEGNNLDKVVDAAEECGYNYLKLLLYTNWQCMWTSYQCAQTILKCLRWMGEAVWVGYQPQPWHNHNTLTPQPPSVNPIFDLEKFIWSRDPFFCINLKF